MRTLLSLVRQSSRWFANNPVPAAAVVVPSKRSILIFGLLCALTTAVPIAAETVIQNGLNGLNGLEGIQGAAGEPGLPGGDGADGMAANATANAVSENNTAEAIGGRGGQGGRGGGGLFGSGADGGDGGNGGNGADAIATATTVGREFVRAVARGGSGGQRGQGGRPSNSGPSTGVSGNPGVSGQSGDAAATANVEVDYTQQIPAIALDGEATAAGGNAAATIQGSVIDPGVAIGTHSLLARASSLDAGDAFASADGSTTNGALSVSAVATAQFGGSATANATGLHTGSGKLTVSTTGSTDDSFRDEIVTAREVSASGIATLGADVTVSATLLNGRDNVLHNAVSGSTSGLLELRQSIGGPLLGGPRNPDGVTRTSLEGRNDGGGALDVEVEARSRRITRDAGDGDVIIGDVTGRSDSGADVSVDVIATGFNIRQEQPDDASSRSRIFGFSNGGNVSVGADFRGGESLTRFTTEGLLVIADSGPSLEMINSVDGDTTGQLTLLQKGRAGDGKPAQVFTPPGGTSIAGAGGDVLNRLTKSGSFESLKMDGRSQGGNGGSFSQPNLLGISGVGGAGGNATTQLDAINVGGGVEVIGNALGGHGGTSSVASGGTGGDALIDFRAETTESGHPIKIGSETPVEFDVVNRRVFFHGARGGLGGTAAAGGQSAPPMTGDGGQAISRSEGQARADSIVEVYDLAIGGQAGRGAKAPIFLPMGTSGRGGDATSSAFATNQGESSVLAQSTAIAGFSGHQTLAGGGGGGDAEALAMASGLGTSRAIASATGGGSSSQDSNAGLAHATADATGSLAIASADANTGGGPTGRFRAMVTREMSNHVRLESIVSNVGGSQAPSAVDVDGSAYLTGKPGMAEAALFTMSHSKLGALLADTTSARIEALGEWTARSNSDEISTQIVELDITLGVPSFDRPLALAFSSTGELDGGFESLLFRLEIFGDLFGEEIVFDNLADAKSYFSELIFLGDTYLDGVFQFGSPAIRAIFEVDQRKGQRLAFGAAAVVVPEPSTALLLGLGLLITAARRPSACRFTNASCYSPSPAS